MVYKRQTKRSKRNLRRTIKGGAAAENKSNRKSKGKGKGKSGRTGRVLRPGGGFGSGLLSNPPIGPGGTSGMSGVHIRPPPPDFHGEPLHAPFHVPAVFENPEYSRTVVPLKPEELSQYGTGEGWESPRPRLKELITAPYQVHRPSSKKSSPKN